MKSLVLVLASMSVTVVAPTASAQLNPDRVPADAILYVDWAGLDRVSSEPGTHLHEVLKKSTFRELYQGIVPAVTALMQMQDPMIEDMVTQFSAMGTMVIDSPTTLYVGPADAHAEISMPKAALVCRAGERAVEAYTQLRRMQEEWDGAPIVLHLGPGMVGVATPNVGPADLVRLGFDAEGTAPAESLASQPRFAAHSAQSSMFSLWLDAEAAMAEVEEAMAVKDPSALEEWIPIKDVLGLAGLEELWIEAGFAGKSWEIRSFIGAPSPRKGALAMIEGNAITESALKAVPATASMAGGLRLDLPAIIEGLVGIASQLEPSAVDEYHQGLMRASETLGLDVQSELLGALGTDWLYYCDRGVGGSGLLGTVLVHEPKDAARLSGAVDKLVDLANRTIEQEMAGEPVNFSIKPVTSGDLKMHCFSVPFVAPSLAFHGGRMYLALYPSVLVAAVASAEEDRPSLLENPALKRLSAETGSAPSHFYYEDLPGAANEKYANMLMFSQVYAGLAGLLGVEASPMLIPPLAQLAPHLEPQSSFTFSDDTGIHGRIYSPFPGSSILSSSQIGSMYVAMTWISLLPMVARPIMMADEMIMLENLDYLEIEEEVGEVEFIDDDDGEPDR